MRRGGFLAGRSRLPQLRVAPERTKDARVIVTRDLAAELHDLIGLDVSEHEPMSKYTSLRIGGPADWFVTATSVDDLVRAVQGARRLGLPFLVIGNGTNLLVLDGGVRGLVIRNRAAGWSRVVVDSAGNALPPAREAEGRESHWRVAGGTLWTQLARATVSEGWLGAEWGNSIPGS